jgi:hypothetical protein
VHHTVPKERSRITLLARAHNRFEFRLTLSPSYYRTVAYAYGKHVELTWARVPVGKVDSIDVKAWAASMTRDGSSATVVNRAVGILAGILDDAMEHRALAFNPARRFKRGEKPTKAPKRHVYLTEADVCQLAEESGRHADLVLTLAFTGLRWGEAIALAVADVEFLKTPYLGAPQRRSGRATVRGRADEGQRESDGAGSGFGASSARAAVRGPVGRRPAIPGARRRVLEAAQLRLDGMVQQGRRACEGADDHAARSTAHVREFGRQFRCECPCGVADAGPQRSQCHVAGLRRSVRQRPRCGGGQSGRKDRG